MPQGAPTSPVLSNLICHRLDLKLIQLASDYFCHYTRYADDITFSSTKSTIPELLITKIKSIIIEEGFFINAKKERIENYYRRQEVTGLTVNKKPNVKRKFVRNILIRSPDHYLEWTTSKTLFGTLI